MKKIVLVYPEFPSTYWSLKHALAIAGKKATTPPLSLLTVAALLPHEYRITLIDLNVRALKDDDLARADLVFVSAMLIQKESFDAVVSLCNAAGVPVVAGGPYPTMSHEKISGVDHFILGEAETSLPQFIADYENGSARRIYFCADKPDLTRSPAPRFDLIDYSDYQNMALQTSRGCPFNCEFCDIIELFGRHPRYKDTAQCINEMEMVYRQGFRGSLFIVDDNFIGNKKKVKELLRGIIAWQEERGRPFTFFTEASINLAQDDELLDLMVRAGFDMVFVGIETPETSTLAACNKKQNTAADLYASVVKIQEAGIEVAGGFIVGFDQDREDIFERQIEFIQRAGIPMAMVGLLTTLPGTQLYRRLEKEGRLKLDRECRGNNTHNLEIGFKPVMEERVLIQGYKKIISEIYGPGNYFRRCLTFLFRLPRQTIQDSSPIGMTEIRAFLLSLSRQTCSSYGLTYLAFLLRVLMFRRERFPQAVALAVKGHHFFTITEEIMKADELSLELARAKKMAREALALIAPSGARLSPELATLKKEIVHFRKKLRKRYDRLSDDVQHYLKDSFDEFERFFSSMIDNSQGFDYPPR